MAGRQIRWRSAGRGAGICAAVVAAIISLPALLGEDRPPPVPDDVGLTPPPATVAAPVDVPVEPVGPEPPPAEPARKKREPRTHQHRKEHRSDKESATTGVAPAPVYVPAYSPPAPDEFTIEAPSGD